MHVHYATVKLHPANLYAMKIIFNFNTNKIIIVLIWCADNLLSLSTR